MLDDITRRACSDIPIRNDEAFEDQRESFNVIVSNFSLDDAELIGFSSVNITQVVIVDDDRIVELGFLENSTSVTVEESVGAAVVCVGISIPVPNTVFNSQIGVIVGTRPESAGWG